jgi:hypothetical protein
MMVRCPKCGTEIKYIPMREHTVVVDAAYVEVVTDRGMLVKGHSIHKCPNAEVEQHE